MLIALYITIGYFMLFFIVATVIKNNSIVDIGWGLGFVLTSWILFLLNQTYTVTQILVNVMISLWGLRLFYHILKRNIFEEEDFRYKAWRKAWGKYVVSRAFLQVFLLQGILQFIIGSTSFYINTNETSFQIVSIIGIVIWGIGYYFQVVGDAQLKKHIQTKRGTLLTDGLWSKTRHPNYFGEALMWWGIFVFSLFNQTPIYYIVSPITITIVLYFISTPLLEKKMALMKGWEDYAKKTPMFFPFQMKHESK